MIKHSSLFLLLKVACRCKTVSAETDYAVYFDDVDQRNVWGDGYRPLGPHRWAGVQEGTWPIFTDWGSKLIDSSVWDRGNQCEDLSDAKYYRGHRQSPITLTEDDECTDRRKISNKERGICGEDEARFYTSPYGLGVDLSDCTKPPMIRQDRNRNPWILVGMSIKVPAEHNIKRNGTVEEFHGEIHLEYKGSGKTSDSISIVSVLLKAESAADDNEELGKYIDGWKKVQTKQYEECGVRYMRSTCGLSTYQSPRDNTDSSSPTTGATQAPTPSPSIVPSYVSSSLPSATPTVSPSKTLTAMPTSIPSPLPSKNPTMFPTTKPTAAPTPDCSDCEQCCSHRGLSQGSQYSNLVQVVIDQEDEIARLKDELARCHVDFKPPSHRMLGKWNKVCDGSHFCPINLYKNTGTDFYYRYQGSLTVPPCTEGVHWRVMIKPLIISKDQLRSLEELTYKHIDQNCELKTVGKRRSDNSCTVDVNRPLQSVSIYHDLRLCDAWVAEAMIKFPRGGTPDSEVPGQATKKWKKRKNRKNRLFSD